MHLFNMNYPIKNCQLVGERYSLRIDEDLFVLVGFTPLVAMNAAHHMLTFACASPGSNKQVW